MAEKKQAADQTIEQAFDDLSAANSAVSDAQSALESAESDREQKIEKIKALMDELKGKATELGVEVVQNASEAAQAVQEKLDEGKDAWASEAQETPNAARRQLRLFWGVIGAVGGLIVGLPIGYVLRGVL